MGKWISRIVITLAVLLLMVRIADRIARRGGSLPPTPLPNGYETLLALAGQIRTPTGDIGDLSSDAVRQSAQTNRESLGKLHEALRMETGVLLRTESGWVEKHAEDVKKLKRLAGILAIQSRVELLNGNTNASAQSFLDMILLGHSLARGGILTDGIHSLGVETIGTAMLRAQVPYLDAVACRSASQELERAEALRDQPEKILKTEKDWSVASFGLINQLGGLVLRKSESQRRAEFIGRYHETMKRTRRLMLMLAARAVELETGQKVSSPAALVPAVLKSVPMDPQTSTPMKEIPVSPNDR